MCNMIITKELFDQDAHLFYFDDQGNVSNVETIGDWMLIDHAAAQADKLNIKYIGIKGVSEYSQGIKEDIEKQLALKYANNNITVEVLK